MHRLLLDPLPRPTRRLGTLLRRTAWATLAAAGLAIAASPAQASDAKIALTFDDVPGLTILPDQPYVDWFNMALLAGLKRHHFPAIGFVNEGKFDDIIRDRQIAIVKSWLDAGMDLGNHTFSHESPNDLGADGYIADIARGEPITKALLIAHHKTMRWFRHPYLETGTPAPVKRQIDAWLSAHGYQIAPVTLDADDWEYAEPYDDAIARHNEPLRLHIRAEYLAHTEAMINWARVGAKALFGRDIAYVILLHDTRLNADCIDDLAAMLKRQKLKPVSLETAMKDPAYKTPDPYSGKDGIEWLERWSIALKRDLPWGSYSDPQKDVVEAYDKVDPSGR